MQTASYVSSPLIKKKLGGNVSKKPPSLIIFSFSSHKISLVNLVFYPIFAEEENFFEIAEAVFVGWFTFEYVVRFIAAPRKSQ